VSSATFAGVRRGPPRNPHDGNFGHSGEIGDTAVSSYVQAVERAVDGRGTVLDVGCGGNSPIGRFAERPPYSVGIDLHEPWLEESRAKGIHDEYHKMDVLDLGTRFDAESFDVALACDLLEHLEHDAGLRLLAAMEQVARRRVVILTPNGFVPQGETWGNPLQEHRSGWTVDEMRRLGYTVEGVNGLRILRGERGTIRWPPRFVWGKLARLSEPLARRFPRLAFHIICTKDVEDPRASRNEPGRTRIAAG
jgi:SAM-dependent methyltransferase